MPCGTASPSCELALAIAGSRPSSASSSPGPSNAISVSYWLTSITWPPPPASVPSAARIAKAVVILAAMSDQE
jgi:hypothetical protein